jgi:hypothetical protein
MCVTPFGDQIIGVVDPGVNNADKVSLITDVVRRSKSRKELVEAK